MRVAPLGIATPVQPLAALCAAVAELDRLTHDTTVANAGAAAVAAVVSAGVGGASWAEASALGVVAAAAGARHGSYVPGADVGRRIGWALDLVRDADDDTLLDLVDGLVGTGVATQEAVPAAFAVASQAPDDPWRAGLLAARLGGDSDTVAAMAGAMVGACTGLTALPEDAVALVREVNDLAFEHLAEDLLALRATGGRR
jgi:ADP-ribosylglycohydrolase